MKMDISELLSGAADCLSFLALMAIILFVGLVVLP